MNRDVLTCQLRTLNINMHIDMYIDIEDGCQPRASPRTPRLRRDRIFSYATSSQSPAGLPAGCPAGSPPANHNPLPQVSPSRGRDSPGEVGYGSLEDYLPDIRPVNRRGIVMTWHMKKSGPAEGVGSGAKPWVDNHLQYQYTYQYAY